MSDCEYILSNGDKMNYDQMRKHLLDNYEKLVSQELKGEKQPLEPEPEPQLKTAPPLTKNGQKARKVFISYLTRETNWDANQRKRIEDNPELYYTPISYEEPTEAAREIIADLGIDEAREYATSQDSSIPAVVKMAILGEVMNYYQKKAKIDEEIEAYNKFERAFEDLAKLGTRYGQAISQLRQIYQLSGLAKVASVNKNIMEDLKKGEGLSQSDIEEQQQEVIDALKKELEGFRDIEKDFEEKLTRLSGIKLSKKAQQAIDGLDDLINSLDKSGRLYDATLGIPIEILKAGLKMIKYSLKIGLTVAEAINEGVIEIKKLLSEKGINFNKEKELRELLNGLPQLVEYQKEEQEGQAETPRQREIKPTKKSRIGALDEFVEEVPLSDGNENYVEEIKKQIIEDNEKVKLGGLLLNRKALRKLIARVLKNEDLDLSDDNVNKEVLEALGWRMSQSQSEIVITLADELRNNRELPPFIAAQYEEIINFIIDLNEGTAINKAINDSVIASMLSSVYNNLVNMLGAGTAVTAMISTILKARSFDALKVAAKEFKFAWYEASTILNVKIGYSTIPVELGGKKVSIPESLIPLKLGGGRVSRGASYKDLLEKEAERMKLFGLSAMSSGIGEMSVRTLEYIPHIKNKGFFAYIFSSPIVKSQKVIGRALEAVDTFASAVAAGLTDYYHINRYVNKFYPNATQKEKSALVFDAMYNIRNSDYKKAKLDLIATGISKPQRREIIRTVYERATRARDKKTKELYDKFYDQKRQEAIDYLKKHNLPIDDDQIKLYANLFAGDFNPVVGRGQLQAQRLTGKLDTHGVMATISWFLNVLRGGINKRIREERGVNRVLLQVFDRTVFVLGFPFQASIGRWTEMGLELTPYGLIKGAAYKASAYSKRKINASEAERISDMGNDFMIRSLFGAAVMMLVPVGEGDDDDTIIQGLEKETDWKQERVQGAGLPKQSIKISEERRYPLLLLGNIGIALTWKADVMKKLKEKREKQEALTEEEQENLAFSITMASAAAAWEIAYTSSWLKTSVDYGKMFSEFDTDKIGTRIGRMMAAHIPYNRLQQEMAQLLDPRSETHKGFAVNVLNQFSIVRAINEGKPNFDHLGREYDYGDIWINSADGFRKFITGRKYRTELDDYLAEIRFAMSDAIMPKSAEKSNYVIISRPKIEIMNDDEWYDFKKYTADYFRNNLENFYEGKKWKNLTIPEQREAVSQILILSRQAAAAKINGYRDIGDYLYMVKEKKQSFEKDRFLLKDVTKDLSDNFQY